MMIFVPGYSLLVASGGAVNCDSWRFIEHYLWCKRVQYRILYILNRISFLCVRIGKQRVDSEQSISDRGGKIEMEAVYNHGYHTESTFHH